MSRSRTGSFLRPALLAPLLCFIYGLWVINVFETPLALVTLGERFAPIELQSMTYSEEGYDGQFVYYFARYGLEAEAYVDLPAYRGQRILLSILGWLISFGQTDLLPYGVFAVNLLAIGIGTYFLEDLLQQHHASRWITIGYALSMGIFGAARLSTTEPLAYALILGGIWLIRHEKWLWSAILFALAALSKETILFFPAAYGFYLLYQRRLPLAIAFGSIVLIPFLLWQIALYQTFGTFGIGSGGGGATGFELVPFGGVIKIFTTAASVGEYGAVIAFLLLVGTFVLIPTLWSIWRCLIDLRNTIHESDRTGWTLATTLLFANVAIMPFVPFSTYREPLGILRFIVGLQIALILYAAERRNRRVLMYSTLWFVSSILVIVSDFALASA